MLGMYKIKKIYFYLTILTIDILTIVNDSCEIYKWPCDLKYSNTKFETGQYSIWTSSGPP